MAEHAAVASMINKLGRNRVGPEMMSRSQPRSTLPMKLFHFNISGQPFIVSSQLVQKFPGSKFCSPQQLAEHWEEDLGVFYFDRDPALFNTILNIFRYDVLNTPPGYDQDLVLEEAKYWNVPISCVNAERNIEEARIEADFRWLEDRAPPPPSSAKNWRKWRYRAWCFVTDPLGPHTPYRKLSIAFCSMSILLTIFYLVIFGINTSIYYRQAKVDDNNRELLTNNSMNSKEGDLFTLAGCSLDKPKIDCFSRTAPSMWIIIPQRILSAIFFFETIARLVLCPGFVYFKSVINCLDIIAGISSFVVTITMIFGLTGKSALLSNDDLTYEYVLIFLQAAQVFRVFKIFQYASSIDGLMIMVLTMKASLKELLLLFMYLLIAMFLYSNLIFFAELGGDPHTGIPDILFGYWWAIITMTTVGYGDFYPTTTAGYFIGVMCSISGIIVTALPVAVIGSNFNTYWEHNRRRKSRLSAPFYDIRGQRKDSCSSEIGILVEDL